MNDEREVRRRPPIHFFVGAASLVLCEVLLFARIEPVYTYFYPFVWWSYILFVDGLVFWRTGESLLVNRRWEFLVLSFWSVAAWNVYEIFNFRLQNWYYVNAPVAVWKEHLHTTIAFATVLPGVFETTELLRSFHLLDKLRTRPVRISRTRLLVLFLMGLCCVVLPLLWPRYFFPLVWGWAVFMLEPIIYLRRGRSLLADLERGDPRRFCTLLLAGVVAGGLWEFWNFWTRTKWIYTVPGFEEFKLFEMPLLGFVGFAPFVVECYVMYAFLGLFRGNRGWERDACRAGGAPRWLAVAGALGALVFNFLVCEGITRWTVYSHNRSIRHVAKIAPEEADRLEKAGIEYPPDLLIAVERRGVRAVALEIGMAPARITALSEASRLIETKGIGFRYYELLRSLGITRLDDLASRDIAVLARKLRAIAEKKGIRSPYERQVGVWVREARRLRRKLEAQREIGAQREFGAQRSFGTQQEIGVQREFGAQRSFGTPSAR
jgi:hypothetical protein